MPLAHHATILARFSLKARTPARSCR